MAAGRGIGRSAIALAALIAAPSHALDITVQPRASAGLQDYQLVFPDVIAASPASNNPRIRDGFTIRDHLPFAGAGLTIGSGRLFVDLSGQWSRTGEYQSFNAQGNQFDTLNGYNGVGLHNHYLDSRFSRHELNAALGWALSPNFSAYLGYKYAALSISQARTPFLLPQPLPGDVLQFGSSLMDFSYHGYFLGTTYSLPVSSFGTLSVQASIARLDASFRQHFEGLLFTVDPLTGPPLLDPSLEDSTVRGSSTGLNVGISWTGSFGVARNPVPRLTYTIGLDQSQYRFQAPVTDGDFEEKNTRVRIELRYRFGL
ncbi:MAG: hypothetical protein ACHQDD_03955 [Steroidobacterales bacterium]